MNTLEPGLGGNPEKRKALIRSALRELKAENAAHQFERICRRLAAQRIASNIVPATGPVAGRGDQGRDFETFPTYLKSENVAGASFIALVGNGAMAAFACTLQQDNLRSKIRADASAIMDSGRAVETIYVFCEANIPVGDRHKWEEEIGEEVSAQVVIFDGNAIAEHLAASDTFWIAEEFLSLPVQMRDDAETDAFLDEEKAGYLILRDKWRQIETPAGVFSEFWDLRTALRQVSESGSPDDLPFWLERAETFIQVADQTHRRRAFYEIAVASLRGLGTLRGYEERLENYFKEALDETDAVSLEDAQVLLMFVAGAISRGIVAIDPEQLVAWAAALKAHVSALLERTESPDMKAKLLQTLASLTFIPDPAREEGGVAEKVDEVMAIWAQLIETIPQAQMFPVNRFASLVSVVSPLIADHPDYRAFTGDLDELVAARSGRAAAAARARDRAMAHFEQGRLLLAIEEIHQARVDWFAGDTLRGSLLALAVAAHAYDRLNLHHAAKYHWLALAHIALMANDPELLDLPSKGILYAAQDDYLTGASFGFLGLFDLGFRLHAHLEENAWDIEQQETLQASYLSLLVLHLYLGSAGSPDAVEWVDALLDQLDLRFLVDELAGAAKDAWGNSPKKIDAAFADQLGTAMFSDAGERRVVRWSALGTIWEVEFANDYETTVVAERFIAHTQIVLGDLAREELALLQTPVRVSVAVGDSAEIRPVPNNEASQWDLTLPDAGSRDFRDVQTETITPIASILADVSVLPSDELFQVIEDAFQRGLASKLFPAVLYDDAFREFVSAEAFLPEIRRSMPSPTTPETAPPEHDELRWRDDPGPTYTPEQAQEFLQNRYERLTESVQLTLPRLLANETTRNLIAALRSEGWLDWQILSAIASVAMHWRIHETGEPPTTPEDHVERMKDFMGPETSQMAEVPLEEFSRGALTRAININVPAVAKTWGLELRRRTPNFVALGRFLDARYGNSSDDVDHEDPFPGL